MNTRMISKEQSLMLGAVDYVVSRLSDNCEYRVGVDIELHKLKGHISSKKVWTKLCSCFSMYRAGAFTTHFVGTPEETHTMTVSIDEYIRVFGPLVLYVPMLDVDKYVTHEINITKDEDMYEFIQQLASVNDDLLSSVMRIININKGDAYENTENINRAFGQFNTKYLPQKRFKEFVENNNIDASMVDKIMCGECPNDAKDNILPIYDISRNIHDDGITVSSHDVVDVCGKLYRIIKCI